MWIEDDEPFDVRPKRLDLGFARDAAADSVANAETLRAMRARAERWAEDRGFEVVEGALVRRAENVAVTIRFSETTTEICTVRATALRPAELRLTIEPASFTDRISARFGKRFRTGDRAFDGRWRVETDDERVAQHLLDARVRAALLAHPLWCRVVYTNGQIELLLDSGDDRLIGHHLLAATEAALSLARATPDAPTTPYR